MKTVEDVLTHFLTEIKQKAALDDMKDLDLPRNMHIQYDYVRFDPENDTLFGGRSAFPCRDTIVTSLKFRRKYKPIKTKLERPGYY